MTIKEGIDLTYEKQSYVNVHGEWIPVSVTDFLNISEDIHGRDVMTFTYGGKVYESLVVIR